MIDQKKQLQAAITGALVLGACMLGTQASAQTSPTNCPHPQTEKCYGIALAGKNDCAAGLLGCSGSAKKNGQGDAYLDVPKGLCQKIVGGSLTPLNNKNAS